MNESREEENEQEKNEGYFQQTYILFVYQNNVFRPHRGRVFLFQFALTVPITKANVHWSFTLIASESQRR